MEVFTTYCSPLGTILLTATDAGLTGLWLDTQKPPRIPRTRQDNHPAFGPVKTWLDAYFRGHPGSIDDLPLAPAGTPFQMQVWDCLRRIPWGCLATYGDIAKEVARIRGKEKMSAQAVGQAVGANPIAIIVPCHRCIGAGGKLTGYNGGLEKKRWLLAHEAGQEEQL